MDEIKQCNSIFEQPWWLEIVAPGRWSDVTVKNDSGVVIARLPYVYKEKLFGKDIYMPPNTQTLGPWIADREYKRGNSQFGLEKEIVNELLKGLPKARNLEITLDSSNRYVLPYHWNMFRITPSFSYRINELNDLEAVYSRFHKSLQKNIRRSEKICQISNEPDIDILYRMIEITFDNQNRRSPDSKEMVRNIVEACERRNHGRMFIARDANRNIQVAAYMIYDENVAYALLSGSDPKYRGSGAKSLIYWEQIKYAATVSKAFDFEGSMIEGIENIVRQFGCGQVINYHVSKTGIIHETMSMLKPRVKKVIGYKM